ncbi:MAG: hypothetical protein IKK84_01775 [Clostridia bacterium]|nr:hypothetical protein [Clostridia bacterium]
MDKFNELRNKYPTFEYLSYDIEETDDAIKVTYNFNVPGLTTFNPTWKFPKAKEVNLSANDRKILETAIFNLGMVEVVSYLKATCSPNLIVKAGALNNEQIAWYKKLYINGLGEFFYRNGLVEAMNIETFLKIEAEGNSTEPLLIDETLEGNLVPVGGGKDSNLTLEVLKGENNTCYIVNPRGASYDSAKIAGYEDNNIYTPKRTLDARLLELNKQGFLNGHTPFSAILAFSSYISAILLGKKYIVLSNEASANEANVEGTNINHQYSKSIEFENDFREYISNFVCSNGPEYFSLLRPLSEWQIVKGFIKEPKYFKVFKSCNVGSKQDIWCENCPKCLYVYIMLAAFLDKKDMDKIFSSNMLNNKELKDIFNGLVYPDYDKPFECVGTKEEINLSLAMVIAKHKEQGKALPTLLKDYDASNENLAENIKTAIYSWNEENNLPEEFAKKLKEYVM